jgi:phage terminase small subunit
MPRLSNEQHEAFAQHYVKHWNRRKASEEAGYQAHYGVRLLAMPEVAARVRELNEVTLKAADITAQRVMLELARVAFADVRRIFDKNGHLIPIHELDDDAAASIAGIEHETRFERVMETDLTTGEPVVHNVQVRVAKVRRFNKDAALNTLAKHFKIVGDEGDGVNALASALADRLKAARKRTPEITHDESL